MVSYPGSSITVEDLGASEASKGDTQFSVHETLLPSAETTAKHGHCCGGLCLNALADLADAGAPWPNTGNYPFSLHGSVVENSPHLITHPPDVHN